MTGRPCASPNQVEAAKKAVADEYCIQTFWISSGRGPNALSEARFMFWFLLTDVIGATARQLGEVTNHDPSAVTHGLRRFRGWMTVYPSLTHRYHRVREHYMKLPHD